MDRELEAYFRLLTDNRGDHEKATAAWRARFKKFCPFSGRAPDAVCVLDFETCGTVDLKSAGLHVYAEHPATRVLCASYLIGNGEPKTWVPGEPVPEGIKTHSGRWVAHNVQFERALWPKEWGPCPPLSRWSCTLARAAAVSLPLALGQVCEALGMPQVKDAQGYRNMLMMCKPHTKTGGWEHHTPERLDWLRRYCEQDVRAEAGVHRVLPELSAREREIWELTLAMGDRGLHLDREGADACMAALAAGAAAWDAKIRAATRGRLTGADLTAPARLKEYLGVAGSLDKARVAEMLAALMEPADEDDPDGAETVLEGRRAVGQASTAKVARMCLMRAKDGRIHDSLQYHGASTGRWSGRGIQPQNLPKAQVPNVDACLADMARGDWDAFRWTWGDEYQAVKGCLRGLLTAGPGKTLLCADFAQIEARVLLWMAGDLAGLQDFVSGKPYEAMAARILGLAESSIGNPSAQRDLGKATVLGCGYQMGPARFLSNCAKNGVAVDQALAEKAVAAYRERYPLVVNLWNALEAAAMAAVIQAGTVTTAGRCQFQLVRKHLWVTLPSGRGLVYPFATIMPHTTPWGMAKDSVSYMALGKNKKWQQETTYGGKLTENLDQAISRDIMAGAMLAAEQVGWECVLTVHDEVVCECDPAKADVPAFERLMATVPPWAPGLALAAKGWTGRRYRK